MTLKNEEMLSKYFERKMTSSEEQNFLISVAANDELRLAFRSQLELMRAVSNDKDGIRSAVEVRARTLAAIGLSTLAADSFLEHDLLRQPKDEAAAISTSAMHQASITTGPITSATSGIASFFKSSMMTVVAGLTVGFIGAMAIFSGGPEEQVKSNPGAIIAPQTVGSTNTPQTLKNEQIRENSPASTSTVEVPAAQPIQRPAVRAQRKPAVETNTPETGLQSKANVSQDRTVSRQNAAPVDIKTTINKPGDSIKKE